MLNRRRYLLLTLLLCLLGQPVVAADLSEKRLLLLYSYHPTFPTSDKILQGLREALGKQPPHIDIEYMDSKRLFDDVRQRQLLESLSHTLKHRPPYDVIITADDNATEFAVQHRNQLFADTPLIFLGVNDQRRALRVAALPFATGVFEQPSFLETLQLGHRLFPNRKRVYYLTDSRNTSQFDQDNLQRAISRLNSHQQQLEFHRLSLAQLSWQALQQRLNKLGDGDLVLLISAFADANQHSKTFYDSLRLIRQATKVPILHTYEHGVGEGAFGGYVVSHTEQGRHAGLMAYQLLNGRDIATIAAQHNSPNLPLADWPQMQRFAIDESMLPRGSRVLNQPIPIWETHWREIILASLLALLLVLLIVVQAIQNYRMHTLTARLEEQSSFLRLLMETLPDLVWIKDPDGVFLACNRRFERFFGASQSEILGKTDFDFVEPELAQFFRETDLKAIRAHKPSVNEEQVTFADDGHQELLETIKTPVYERHSGKLLGVLGVGRDITLRKQNEDAMRLSATVVANTAEGVVITNAAREILEVNQAFCDITGYSHDEVIGKNPKLLQSGQQDDEFYSQMWQEIHQQGRWRGELINRKKDGSLYPSWQTITAVFDDQGTLCHYVSVFSDITQIKQSQEEVFHLAYHDTLTNLPNRLLLKERLNQAIKHAHRKQRTFTLMFVDLDNFKNINDTQGHNEGDLLLQNIATLLRHTLRDKDTTARIGGDEFILLFDDVAELQEAEKLAGKILSVLSAPIELSESSASISASIGICQFPQDGDSADELLKNADTAMYRAKQQGRNNFQFYSAEFTRHVVERVELEKALRNALQQNEFCLHYQPQIDLNSGQIIGAEALLRWHSDTLGNVSPDRFIPVAEESGLILALGHWVVNEACRQIRQWKNQQLTIGKVAVNISGAQISKTDLAAEVRNLMAEYQLSPTDLSLEVTETFVMQHQNTDVSQLSILHGMNLELAIDDFGTGYSSLSYLKKLPINKLKIDKSFIQDIPHDPDDMAIARTIIALADSLGLTVIAEGVETEEQAAYLKATGCHQAQGYLYGKPMSAEQLQDFIDNYQVGQ